MREYEPILRWVVPKLLILHGMTLLLQYYPLPTVPRPIPPAPPPHPPGTCLVVLVGVFLGAAASWRAVKGHKRLALGAKGDGER